MHEPPLDFHLPLDKLITRIKGLYEQKDPKIVFPPTDENLELVIDFLHFAYTIITENGAADHATLKNETILPVYENDHRLLSRMNWENLSQRWAAIESPMNYALALQSLYALLKPLPLTHNRWLSLGSGPGLFETYFANKFLHASITAIDFAKKMTDIHKKIAEKYSKNQVVIHGDMSDLFFDNNSYDVIICNNSLQWLTAEQLPKALGEMHRVLKKDGVLILLVHHYQMSLHRQSIFLPKENILYGVPAPELAHLVRAAGFRAHDERFMAVKGLAQFGGNSARSCLLLRK